LGIGEDEGNGEDGEGKLELSGNDVNERDGSVALQGPGVFRLGLEVMTGTRLVEAKRIDAV